MRSLLLAVLLATQFTAFAKEAYIPVAGVTPGANGSYWRTDVRIFNPSTTDEIDVTLHFLPQGQDGRNISGRMYHLGKQQTLILDNVVAELAPSLPSVVGAIWLEGESDFIASSRTYTKSSSPQRPGTYGQFVPALTPADAKAKSVVLHAAVRPDARTNAGVMNPNDEEVHVRLTLLGISGHPLLDFFRLTVPPKSMQHWSLEGLAGGLFLANGVIILDSTKPVFAWGSIVDNDSGDAVFVRGE